MAPLWVKASPLVLTNEKSFYELGLHLEILEDKTSKMTVLEVQRSKNFKKSKKKVTHFGFSKSAFWARFKIKNQSKSRVWILSFNNYQQNNVSLFKLKNNEWEEQLSGDNHSFSTRGVKAKPITFILTPGDESLYFLRVEGVISQINVDLSTPIHFAGVQTNEDYILGIFFGLIITMGIYNLFLFISTKNESYLLYVGYVFFAGLVFANVLGFSQRYLFQNLPWMNNYGYIIFMGLTGLFATLFTISFLELKETTPKLYKMMFLCLFSNIFLIFSAFLFPIKFSVLFMNINLLFYTPLVFLCGFIRTKMNYRPSRYFLGAFGALIITVIINTLMIFKILPDVSFFRQYGALLGHAFELILISMGLADRFNLAKEEALKNQKLALEIQRNFTDNLRKEVENRTSELREKNEYLKSYDYTVAHDLTNPISVAMTYLDYYQNIDPEKKEKRDSVIIKTKEAIEKSLAIINGILLNFTVDEVDLTKRNILKIIDMTLDHLQLKIEEKKANIIIDLKQKELICNDVSMYQVFTNLISNSLKYSKEGNVEIKISSFLKGEEFFLELSDNGIGIEKERVNTIFKLKSREEREDLKDLKVKGHGIGLNIVQRLVKENNGRVEVKSALGKGTTFTLIFPNK